MQDFSAEYASDLIRGIVELLWSKSAGLSGNEVIAQLSEKIRLTGDEIDISSSLFWSRYAQTVRLVTLPLVKVGWLFKTDKGQWYLTEDGRAACRRFLTPRELYLEAQRLYTVGHKDVPKYFIFLEAIREEGWETIASYIKRMNSVEVRRLFMLLLDAMQFHITWEAPPHKKRGQIDMIASVDPIGANAIRIVVQIKHTGQPVTLDGFKSLSSILDPNDFGILFSSGGFTSEVKETQDKSGYQKINVMDLAKFYDLWMKHYDRLGQEAHILLPLLRISFLSPLSEESFF